MARTAVVLVNYKGAADTEQCLRSLHALAAPPEIVVVDNTPHDPELPSVLANFPTVTVLNAAENLGFGRGNNLGIDWVLRHSPAEFVFILNNDTTIATDTLHGLETAMDAHPEAGIITARIVFAENPAALWYGGGEVDWKRGGGVAPGVLSASDAPLALTARYVTFASGCAMLVRRELFERLGGFDPRFFMYEEDLEFCLRALDSGFKIWYEPSALVTHFVQGSLRQEGAKALGLLNCQNSNLPFFVYHVFKNRMINMHDHAKGKNRLVFLIFFPLFAAKWCIRYALHGRWDGLKAVFQAFRDYRRQTVTCRSTFRS